MRSRKVYIPAIGALALVLGGAAGGAQATPAEDPPFTLVMTTPSVSVEYGQPWYLEAHSAEAGNVFGEFTGSGTLSGTPAGYVPLTGAYKPDAGSTNVYMAPAANTRTLPAGAYQATLTMTGFATSVSATAPLTISPAALGITLAVAADPSNPANAIVSARFTGSFADTFFSTADPSGPVTPAGTWTIRVTDGDGVVANEFTADRTDQDDILGVSSYWSDVPPGEYTATAAFTPAGDSAGNFAITDAAPVAYSAAAAPGSGSTAPPAPPAPPATESAGMALPLWVPIAAGVLSAGLLALLIVQIVRLRRAGVAAAVPAAPRGVAA
jgi:hypothetical protein